MRSNDHHACCGFRVPDVHRAIVAGRGQHQPLAQCDSAHAVDPALVASSTALLPVTGSQTRIVRSSYPTTCGMGHVTRPTDKPIGVGKMRDSRALTCSSVEPTFD